MKQLCITLIILFLAYFTALFTVGGQLLEWNFSPVGRYAALAISAFGLLGIVYFVVDSFRREYQQDRTLPIALAIAGVFSFGLTTIVYFMVWGWQDRHVKYASDFCDACASELSEVAMPLDLTTISSMVDGLLGPPKSVAAAIP